MAHQRLAFNELFLLEMGLALRQKNKVTKEKGIVFHADVTMM
jgi:hypothetical protein